MVQMEFGRLHLSRDLHNQELSIDSGLISLNYKGKSPNFHAMSDTIINGPYKINHTQEFADRLHNMTPEFRERYEQLFLEMMNFGPRKNFKEIVAFVEKYPRTPKAYDILISAHTILQEYDKGTEISLKMLREFPDYIFPRMLHLSQIIEGGNLQLAKELLGPNLSIKDVYPDRTEFHVNEVGAYELEVIRYLLAIDDVDEAEERFNKFFEMAPESIFFKEVQDVFSDYWGDENENFITSKYEGLRDTENDPDMEEQLSELQNEQVRVLYEYEMSIPWQSMSDILELPRESLVQDLIWVLTSNKEYSDFYLEEIDGNPVLHSIFILGELKATESLPAVLNFLRLDGDTLENWFGDHLSESLWWYFYQVAEQNPELLKDALIDKGLDCFSKVPILQALTQMALHHRDLNERVAALFESTFTYYLQFEIDHEELDFEFLSFAICELYDNRLAELIPSWDKLYEKGFVDESICGDLDEFKTELKRIRRDSVRPVLPIQEFYNDILDNWFGYRDEKSDDDMTDAKMDEWNMKSVAKQKSYLSEPLYNQMPVVREAPKIGRNEPCPCGSGRKYKVCCGKD
jgi:Protein of unknown function (DUF1186)/SEC-C motif